LDVRFGRWDDSRIMPSAIDPAGCPVSAAPAAGPSLAKPPPGRVVRHHTLELVAVLDGWWAHVLERADVVSEGAVVATPAGPIYYGTTSVRCRPEPRPEALRQLGAAELVRLLLADPHARLRVVRLVHREVAARASGPLGVVRIDLRSGAVAEPGSSSPVLEVAAEVTAQLGAEVARSANE
jgi:hypothetical protein